MAYVTVNCRDLWLWCSWIHCLDNLSSSILYPSTVSSFPITPTHYVQNIHDTFQLSKVSFFFLIVPSKVLGLSFVSLAWVTYLSLNKPLYQCDVNDLINLGHTSSPVSRSSVRHILTTGLRLRWPSKENQGAYTRRGGMDARLIKKQSASTRKAPNIEQLNGRT